MANSRYTVAVCAAALALAGAARALETAESLLVDLDMSSVGSTDDGAFIGTWRNKVSDSGVGDFVPVSAGQGARYSAAGAGGVPAAYFDASAGSVMWNGDTLPATLTGNNSWSVEAWVFNPTADRTETFFTWTYRGGTHRCLELRYNGDTGNAVEHWSDNMSWNGAIPLVGMWHHIAVARDDDSHEVLYLDGVKRNEMSVTMDIPETGNFYIGGARSDNVSGDFSQDFLFSGYVAAVRVHSGTLTAAQVAANFAEESASYQNQWKGGTGLWSEPSNWTAGILPGDVATIRLSGEAQLDCSATLRLLELYNGGLAVDGGSLVLLNGIDQAFCNGGGTTSFAVRSGALDSPAYVEGVKGGGVVNVSFGTPGAAAGTATARFGREFNVARNGTAHMTVEDGADLAVQGWCRGAFGGEATADITINGGEMFCNDWFLLATDGGSATFTMNGGHFTGWGFEFTYAGNNENQYGILHLNGGTLEIAAFQNANTNGTQAIYFDGGTLKARSTQGNFIPNSLDACVVQAGGATFDVPGTYSVDVRSAFSSDPESPGGAITKNGTGQLRLIENFAFDGPVAVNAGTVVFDKLAQLQGVTSLAVADGAAVVCNETGGAAALLARLAPGSAGTILLTAANAAEDVDLTNFPDMTVGFLGSFDYTGTITYAESATPSYTFVQNQGEVYVNQVLADIGGRTTSLDVSGLPGYTHKLVLQAANTFTGGITVDGCTLQFDNEAASGAGPIRLLNGGELVLNNANIDVPALVARIAADSEGALVFCDNGPKNVDFSLAQHPGLWVGGYPQQNFDYTGTIAFGGNEYRFGGGHYAFDNSSGAGLNYRPAIADGESPVKVVGGMPGLFGLAGANTFSGGVLVTNEASIFIGGNAAAWGAPSATTPDWFLFDGGNIRGGGASTVLPATMGVTVGPGGMKSHVWSNATQMFLGDLHGAGPIRLTDTGILAFGGAANDYTGTIGVANGSALQIGSDAAFSWDFAQSMPVLEGANAQLILYIRDGATYDLAASVSTGRLRKGGPGTMTVSAAQATSGTSVDAGTLAVDANGLLAGDLAVYGTFEIRNGAEIHVGALTGTGLVTAPEGTTARLAITGGDFSGTVAPNVTIVKEGTGRAALHFAGDACAVEVLEGTLAVEAARIARPVVAAGATLELVSGGEGLLGRFYAEANTYEGWDTVIGDLGRIAAFEEARTPLAEQYSTAFGDGFDSRGHDFPAGLNGADNWLAVWRGCLWIEEPGVYGFASASDDGSSVFIDGVLAVSNVKYQGWVDAQFANTYVERRLQRGWHDIVIGFFEGTGENSVTVRMKAPGAAALENLPTSLLYPDHNVTVPAIADRSAVAGEIKLGAGVSGAAFDVPEGETADTAGWFDVNGSHGDVMKTGEGTLVYAARGAGSPARLAVEEGEVVLAEATAVGELAVAEGAKATVSDKKGTGYRGLSLRFYDSDDNSYATFQSAEALRASFDGDLEPSIVTNTWSFGWNRISTARYLSDLANGERFAGNYLNTDNFMTYMTGFIRLPYDGEYAFGFRADDGVALYIDDERYFFYTGVTSGPDGANGGWKRYTAGLHKVAFAFRENIGNQYIALYIRSQNSAAPWSAWTITPQDILFPEFTYARGLSGAGELDLGAGALWIEQGATGAFTGALSGSAGAYLVKAGSEPLTLSGDLSGYGGHLVAAGGDLRLAPAADVAFGAGAVVEADGTLTVCGPGSVTIDGPLSGSGRVVVDGGATLTVARSAHFTGDILLRDGRFAVASDSGYTAHGGTVLATDAGSARVSVGAADLSFRTPETAFEDKYFRFTFKRTRGNTILQMSELSLYDKDYNRVNLNLAEAGAGLSPAALVPGTFAAGGAYHYGAGEGMDKLFDGNTGTKLCANQNDLNDPEDASKWRVVTMRLADDAAPVAYYSFHSANDSMERSPTDWTLESSSDGENWTVIDTRTSWIEDPLELFTESTRFSHGKTALASLAGGDGLAVPLAVGAGAHAVVNGTAAVSLEEGGAVTFSGLEPVDVADHSLWTLNGSVEPEYDALGPNGLWLIHGLTYATGSAYLNERVDVSSPWRATYRFVARRGSGSDKWADALAFCLHNEPDGAAFRDAEAVGYNCGGANAASAVSFWINLWGQENCGWTIGGNRIVPNDGYICTEDDRYARDGYDVELAYDGASLRARVWHLGTLVADIAQDVDLAAVLGRYAEEEEWDGKAYLGFTAASGGSTVNMYMRDLRLYLSGDAEGSSLSVPAGTAGTLNAFDDAFVLDALTLGAGATLNVSADPAMKAADLDYTVTAAQLETAGPATVALADNGEGTGTFRVSGLLASGGATTVTGGRVAALDGRLSIAVPDSAPDGRIDLLVYPAGAWTGDAPEIEVTGAEETDTRYLKYKAFFRPGYVFVSNSAGMQIILR